MMPDFFVHPLTPSDRDWVSLFTVEHWGADIVVGHGTVYCPSELQGFVAEPDENVAGLVTYQIAQEACEVVTLNSLHEGIGIGTALIDAVKAVARQAGCKRLWLITTNDNTHALRFYQKRGFVLAALHRNAIVAARKIKPQISLLGNDGIPIRDEIELELMLV